MHRYQKLQVWQLSRSFCISIYNATISFPAEEKYGLVSQLRRAAISIPSNIAEGCSRTSKKEFKIFLEISIGSAYEMETQLIIANDLKFIKETDLEKLTNSLVSII